MRKYLQCQGSPLADYVPALIGAGRNYNVDPRFLIAIAGAESTFGRFPSGDFNAWNWGVGEDYESWEDAIETVAEGIRRVHLDAGHDTISEFVWENDPGSGGTCESMCYCVSGCQDWIPNVEEFYSDLDGDPDRVGFPFPSCLESPAVDVYLIVDLSGSFADDLPIFKEEAPKAISGLKALYPNIRFGLGKFEDYPIAPFGSVDTGDKAYERLVDLTFDTDVVSNTIAGLFTRSGADVPESQLPALYQAATGAGQDLSGAGYPEASIPASQQANFRDEAVKVFSLWTDAPFHLPGDPGDIPYPGPGFVETVAAILALDPPQVIGVSSGGGGLSDLEEMAAATGAVAPLGGADCDGDGIVDIAEGDPLVCSIGGDGTGIGEAVTGLVKAATGEGVAGPVGGVTYPNGRPRLLALWVGLATLGCLILASGAVAIRKRRN
jgi:hypothetical protein